jgi:hypothetical protein
MPNEEKFVCPACVRNAGINFAGKRTQDNRIWVDCAVCQGTGFALRKDFILYRLLFNDEPGSVAVPANIWPPH